MDYWKRGWDLVLYSLVVDWTVEMWAWLSVVKNVCVLAGPELKMTEDEND